MTSKISSQAFKDWCASRVANIKEHVFVHDILERNGAKVDPRDDREFQFSCPFHGVDRKPSARYYPGNDRSEAGVWCYVCQEPWDAIALWKKFNGLDDQPFTQILRSIESAYGLSVPEMPRGVEDVFADPVPEDSEGYEKALQVCESRLLFARPTYQKLGDMTGYLSASSVIDKLRFRVEKKTLTPSKAEAILWQLIEKIGEKVRSCPDA